ncbi:MAG: DNA replication/repair protein RecF [Actinomycetota bacterium]
MELQQLWLRDIRSHVATDVRLDPGVNLLTGPNGSGKTNLAEAVGFLVSLRSFRGVPAEALVRAGASSGTVRGEVLSEARTHLIEIEIPDRGRTRVLVNRNRLSRRRDLLEVAQVTVFGPDDLELVKGGPGVRRELLDDAVVQIRPVDELIVSDWERVLRQRNAFLKQVGPSAGRRGLDDSASITLDVWDDKLIQLGTALHGLRAVVVDRLGPFVASAYRNVAGDRSDVTLSLQPGWEGADLAEAVAAARVDDLRRGVTTVGPHRDDLRIVLNGLAARTHASQGEQRCLALALRLGVHEFVTTARGTPPILVLDDVFSELDPVRSAALVASLPAGQTIITSAVGSPSGVEPDAVFELATGGGVVRTR